MQDTINELRIQTHIATTFWYILYVLTLVTRKLQVIRGRSTYRTTALLSEMSIFCVKAGCKIWMASYASKHTSQSFSGKPIVHIQLHLTHTHVTWKFQVICGRSAYWTTAILLDTFFVWFRAAWEIWLESYGPRHASFILWHNIVCVYCKHNIHYYFVRYHAWH